MASPQPLRVGDREINLAQVLKLANLAESGGQAKAMVADGLVKVNGAVEHRKRRQMAVGDVVEVEGLPPVVLARLESPT
jgi:ribosome-associated protein